VQNTSNPAVNWQVNGIAGGNSSVGTITASGAATASYTAPAKVSGVVTVTVTAELQADATKTGSAQVTITPAPNPQVTVSPANINYSGNNAAIHRQRSKWASSGDLGSQWHAGWKFRNRIHKFIGLLHCPCAHS
jgi:hypothetical protein